MAARGRKLWWNLILVAASPALVSLKWTPGTCWDVLAWEWERGQEGAERGGGRADAAANMCDGSKMLLTLSCLQHFKKKNDSFCNICI